LTQALAGFNQHGLVLATDSLATRFDAAGSPEFFNVEKLFPLGPHHAIMSGGAGVSVSLAHAFRRMILRHPSPLALEDLVDFALAYLSQGYARHLQQHGPEPEGFRRIYFILAGYELEAPAPGYGLALLGSEDNELPLKIIPVGNQVVMPRNLGMEMRLFNALEEGMGLMELLAMSRDFLDKQAQAKEEVGPPFYFATITPAGYRPAAM
jgi:hypothetical protein